MDHGGYQDIFSQDFQCENESEVSIKLTEEVTDCGRVFDIEKTPDCALLFDQYNVNTQQHQRVS